jgi:hypothetical protein
VDFAWKCGAYRADFESAASASKLLEVKALSFAIMRTAKEIVKVFGFSRDFSVGITCPGAAFPYPVQLIPVILILGKRHVCRLLKHP